MGDPYAHILDWSPEFCMDFAMQVREASLASAIGSSATEPHRHPDAIRAQRIRSLVWSVVKSGVTSRQGEMEW